MGLVMAFFYLKGKPGTGFGKLPWGGFTMNQVLFFRIADFDK